MDPAATQAAASSLQRRQSARSVAASALARLGAGKIKGKRVKVRALSA